MYIISKNWALLLTAIFSIVVGFLLLVNPVSYAIALIKVTGTLFVLLGIFDIVKYTRNKSAAILGIRASLLLFLLNLCRKKFSHLLSGREPLFFGKRKEIILNSEDFQNEHN